MFKKPKGPPYFFGTVRQFQNPHFCLKLGFLNIYSRIISFNTLRIFDVISKLFAFYSSGEKGGAGSKTNEPVHPSTKPLTLWCFDTFILVSHEKSSAYSKNFALLEPQVGRRLEMFPSCLSFEWNFFHYRG